MILTFNHNTELEWVPTLHSTVGSVTDYAEMEYAVEEDINII